MLRTLTICYVDSENSNKQYYSFQWDVLNKKTLYSNHFFLCLLANLGSHSFICPSPSGSWSNRDVYTDRAGRQEEDRQEDEGQTDWRRHSSSLGRRMCKGKKWAYVGGRKRLHMNAGQQGRPSWEAQGCPFPGAAAAGRGGAWRLTARRPDLSCSGDAGASKGGCVGAPPELWTITPSPNSHMTSYFHNLWGHFRTLRHIFNSLCMHYEFVLCARLWKARSREVSVCYPPQRPEQILTMPATIRLLLGTCSVHMKRNLPSWKCLEAICEEAGEPQYDT